MSLVFVGTYTSGKSEGVYVFRRNTETGAWTRIPQNIPKITNPSFVAVDPVRHRLFVCSETPDGNVCAFRYDPESGALTFLNQQPSVGHDPCHLSVTKDGRSVVVANYSSGTVSLFGVNPDGSLRPASDTARHQGTGPNTARQEAAHAHCAMLDATNRFLYVCDLGMDKVMIYRPDWKAGKLVPNDPPFLPIHPGGGPRHFTLSANQRMAYVIDELDCTITVCARDTKSGALKELQVIPTLPRPVQTGDSCADIHLSPDGKFLYGSNRGHDSLSIFAVHPKTGLLTTVANEPTQGRIPRNFAIDPEGNFVYAANQNSDTIIGFKRDTATGKLLSAGIRIDVPNPVCVVMLP